MLLAVIALSACNPSFKKGKDGLEYKIISDGNGPKIRYGDFMQLNFSTYYNTGTKDSMLNDSRTQGPPIIEKLDSVSTPVAYYEILKQLRKGDSVAIRILTDSAFKNGGQMPAFFQKRHYITTTLKIVNVFTDQKQADSARAASMVEAGKRDSIAAIAQLAKDDKTIRDYLAKNNIKAQKGPKGAYVEIIQPGTGPNADTSVIVKVNYTGKTMDGHVFDSNTDPSKGRNEPLNVNLTNDPSLGIRVIQGWDDGLVMLNKGAKARFYVPSTLGYGARGAGADIPANAILFFDIEVVDILNKAQAKTAADEQRKKMQEMQKHYMDSMQNRNPDTTQRR